MRQGIRTAFLLTCLPVAGWAQEQAAESPAVGILRRLYSAVGEYRALLDEDPKSLSDLLDLTDLRLVDLCLPDTDRARLAVDRPDWAEPHVRWVWSETWQGEMAECLDLSRGLYFQLFGDGRIEARPGTADDWWGMSKGGGSHRLEFDAETIARPSAQLGFSLVESETGAGGNHPDTAVFVDGILPGYLRTGLNDAFDIRPKDRLLEVDGFSVDSVGRLDEFLRTAPPKRRRLLILRNWEEVLVRASLQPIWDDLARAEPAAVVRRAELWRSDTGPGALGCPFESWPLGAGQPSVMMVFEDTAAQRAGLQAGDLVTAIEGRPVQFLDVRNRLRSFPAGTRVELDIERAGSPMTVEAVLDRVGSEELAETRMWIHLGQIDLSRGLRLAADVPPRDTVLLIESFYGGPGPAKEWLDKAIAEPSARQQIFLSDMYEMRADCLVRMRQPQQALQDLDRAMEVIGMEATWILWTKVKLLEEVERFEDALTLHRKLVDSPSSLLPGEDELNLAEFLVRIGRLDEARAICQEWKDAENVGERARAILERRR